MSVDTRPVEFERVDGTTQPALEWLPGRYTAGDDGPQQARTLVVISGDDGLREVDTARERLAAPSDRQADLIESVLQPKLRGASDE